MKAKILDIILHIVTVGTPIDDILETVNTMTDLLLVYTHP